MDKANILCEYSCSRQRIDIEYAQLNMVDTVHFQRIKAVCAARLYSDGIIQLGCRCQHAALDIAFDAFRIGFQIGIVKNRRKVVTGLAAVRNTTSHAYCVRRLARRRYTPF